MAGSNKSSLNNLDQSKADNLLTNLGENINSASNKLITGDFSNATNDLKTLQDNYEELLNAIRSNNLYDILGEKIGTISNSLNELKNRTDQYLQSQEQSINKMLEALPQVASKFRDIEERVRSVNTELGNQSGMQDFVAQVEDLKNKLNELVKLPLDDRSNVEQCAKEMAKIYVETIQSALETANIGKGLIVQAIKDDKVEIANELKKIIADTTMTINTMPNIKPVETQNLNNTAMEVISVTVSAIDKLNNALEKAANIINNVETNKSSQDDSDKLVKVITEANDANMRKIYEAFKDMKPIDFDNINKISNNAQIELNNQLVTMMSNATGDVDNINAINDLLKNYINISESSSKGENSQNNINNLAKQFINEFENKMNIDKLSEIWEVAKSELINIISESKKISESIFNGNNIKISLIQDTTNVDNINNELTKTIDSVNSSISNIISLKNEDNQTTESLLVNSNDINKIYDTLKDIKPIDFNNINNIAKDIQNELVNKLTVLKTNQISENGTDDINNLLKNYSEIEESSKKEINNQNNINELIKQFNNEFENEKDIDKLSKIWELLINELSNFINEFKKLTNQISDINNIKNLLLSDVNSTENINNQIGIIADSINNSMANITLPYGEYNQESKSSNDVNNDNIRRIYEVFKDLRPIDFESISHMSNEAQFGLSEQLISMMSNNFIDDIDNIGDLINSYAKITESSSSGRTSQDNVKRLAQDFIDEFEEGMDLNKLLEIWNEAKSELANIIIESRKITEQIANGNNIRNSLNENIPGIDNINKGLGYYNSNILYEINGQDNLNMAANTANGMSARYYNKKQQSQQSQQPQQSEQYGNSMGLSTMNDIFTQHAAVTSDMINNLDEINKKIKQQGTGSVPPPPPPKNPSSIGDDDFNKRPYLDAEEHRRRVNNIDKFNKEMSNFDDQYKKIKIENMLGEANKIRRGFTSGRYDEIEMAKATASGYGEDYYRKVSNRLSDASELYNRKDSLEKELNSQIDDYKKKYREFEDDPTVEGLNDLNAKSDSIEQIMIELKNILDQIAGDLNSKEVQDLMGGKAFHKIKNTQIEKEGSTLKSHLADSADSFNGAAESLQDSADIFGYKIESTMVNFGNKVEKITNGMGEKLSKSIKTLFEKLVGMNITPMGLATSFVTGSRDYYKKFGNMDIDTMRAMLQQGDFYSQDVLDFNRNKTIELYGKYNGQIDFGEFAKMTNSLISGIQGHVGQDKISGQMDMINLSEPAIMLNKVYGVDSENAINTFYKKIGMSATETENHLYKLIQTAQSSNIPVANYISNITTMSERFRELGVNIDYANSGMQNLMLSGMSYEDSQGLVSGIGNMISNYDNDPGKAAFFGAMTGLDPFNAIYQTKARWEKDENGNYVTSKSATENIMRMIDSEIGLYSTVASGAGEDFMKSTVIDIFKQNGINDDKLAFMAMEKYYEGDVAGLSKIFDEAENADKMVILEGRAELEEKLSLVAEQTDELTTAEHQLAITNMQLAEVGKGIYDMIGKSLTGIISTVGGILIKIVDLLSPIVELLNGLLKKAIENPITSILTAIAAKLGIKGLASYATKGLAGGATGAKVVSGAKTVWGALKAGSKKIPIIGGIIDGLVTTGDSYFGQGKTGAYSIGEGVGSGVGTAGGAIAGAAIGSAIFPVVGTAIGTLIGGWLGGKGGKKIAQVGMDAFDVQEYREGYGDNQSLYDNMENGSLYRDSQFYGDDSTYNYNRVGGGYNGSYENEYSQLFYQTTGTSPYYGDIKHIEGYGLSYDELALLEEDSTSKITKKMDEQMSLQERLAKQEKKIAESEYVDVKDVMEKEQTRLQLENEIKNGDKDVKNQLMVDISSAFHFGEKKEKDEVVEELKEIEKKLPSYTTGNNNQTASVPYAASMQAPTGPSTYNIYTGPTMGDSAGNTQPSGQPMNYLTGSYPSTPMNYVAQPTYSGSEESVNKEKEKGKDGEDLKEKKKEEIDEETLERQKKAAEEVANTNYLEEYRKISQGMKPIEDIEREAEEKREEQTKELIDTTTQKYNELISSAETEMEFLSIIADIDTNILSTLIEVKYILTNLKLSGGSGSDDKSTTHISDSGTEHGGDGNNFGGNQEGTYNGGYAKDEMAGVTLQTETSAKGKVGGGMSAAEDKYDEQIRLAAEVAKMDPNMIKALATQMTGMDNSKSGGMMGLDSVDLQAVISNTKNKDLLKLGELSEEDALKALSNDPMLGALAGAEYVRLIMNNTIGNQLGAVFKTDDGGQLDNAATAQLLMLMLKNDDLVYSDDAARRLGMIKNGNLDDAELNSYEKMYYDRVAEQYKDLTDVALGNNPLADEALPLGWDDFKSNGRGGYMRNGRTYTLSEVEQMIIMSFGELNEDDFGSDNRGKFYLKGRSGENDPRYTAAEMDNIIRMSQKGDYSWLYSTGNIYDPDRVTPEDIAGTNPGTGTGEGAGESTGGDTGELAGMAKWDEKFNNKMMFAPIYVMGSAEYSNQTTQYDPSKFRGYDPFGITLSSGQGLARDIATNPSKYATEIAAASGNTASRAFQSITDKYYDTVNSYDDGSSSTRNGTITNKTNQRFVINVNVNNNTTNDYAAAVQRAITKVTEEYYNTSDINTDITYGLMNNDY